MFNHVGLLGRLAQEPEIRYTTGGTPVARFDLAVPVPSKKKDTPPDYIPVVCWDKWADFCGKYLTKRAAGSRRGPDHNEEMAGQ